MIMPNINDIIKEINDLTSLMIKVGLCVDQNYPNQKNNQILISGLKETAIALKNLPYSDIYYELVKERAFNMKLIDGALIQMRYQFDNKNLKKHTLGFFPSLDLLEYQNNPEIYDNDVLYTDIIQKNLVTCPIRFDYDKLKSQDYVHPASHVTFGQYKNCRIPVKSGLTPFRFINFILRAFYNTAYQNLCSSWRGSASDFQSTITSQERADLHLSYG